MSKRTRRHSNTKGVRQIRRGKTRDQVKAIAKRVGVPYGGERRPVFERWGTIAYGDRNSDGYPSVCMWGTQESAIAGCDPDEKVCLVRVEVLEVLDGR